MNEKHQILVKSHTANPDRYAELVSAAIGKRSLREFARLCDCSAAALSRILHGQNTGASRIKLIEAIAQHADPHSGVTLDTLAEANGYTLQDVVIQADSVARQAPVMSQAQLAAQAVLIQDLTESGKNVHVLPRNHQISDYTSIKPDLLIEVCEFENKKQTLFCEFLTSPFVTPETVIERIERFTLVNAFRYDNTPSIDFLLLVFDLEIYNATVAKHGSKKLPISLRFGLVDLSKGEIIAQHFFPSKRPEWFYERSMEMYIPIPNIHAEQNVNPIDNAAVIAKERGT